ncbi:MAG TPA: 4-(cytidine 5'-diphospho)-2-C-methyl-D-erythritol kinase [Flavobacteriales bacterium]|nr:4-(cytidine 5'-diphospho)-2-C-methyl-D-erythritol kinase [Flavobacteriales bacterium]
MVVFPHAKINLGLNVVARRPDGFHDIESVLVPIRLHDVLEAVVDRQLPKNELVYTRSGLPIAGSLEEDLCYKAVRMIQQHHQLPGLRLHLHKVIPMGAGLGGGSSDGAHTLLLVDRLCRSGLGAEVLLAHATALGSDCAFFLQSEPCVVRGRGELLEPLGLDLQGLHLVLVNPGLHVSTAAVYRNTVPTGGYWDLASLLQRERIGSWRSTIFNTMEGYVLEVHPEIADIKASLLRSGAVHASMTGSGSSVFGLFKTSPKDLTFPDRYRSWTFAL